MGKPNYICSSCKKDFSRKSNAKRHDLTQHQGFAEIVSVGDYRLREKSFVAKTKYRTDGPSDIDPKEARLTDILEKLAPRFEEMERVLSHHNLNEKEMIRGKAIIHAISSPDPVRFMTRYVDTLRKGRSVPLMINCVALSLSASPANARETLKNMII